MMMRASLAAALLAALLPPTADAAATGPFARPDTQRAALVGVQLAQAGGRADRATATGAPAMSAQGASAGSARAGDIAIEGAWVRGAPPGASVAAGYLTLTNAGEAEDVLGGAEADFAGRVELHEMTMTDGMMRMAPIEGGVVVAPGATVTLAPGGNHLMFMALERVPEPGEAVSVTLRFRDAGSVKLMLPVSAVGARSFPQ
ncbi:copper chaperone PCu(A)C [Acuticoccus sp.]|uniref:copper chaperone PCu(A)C n=1 Tax=Acuticoccus sp. TaxID=1904378 RepID=UPI003B516B23